MSREVSAGCLITRESADGLEVLLVHARGATFRRPLFGIPKGLVEPGEEIEAAARRETREETGLDIEIRAALGSVTQKSGKVVHAFWATLAPESLAGVDERGRCRNPDRENDVCRFYAIDKAYELMIPAQREFWIGLARGAWGLPREKNGVGCRGSGVGGAGRG
jgi:predicted NUDIX family NTP pyrophosphohydrolase